MNDNIKEEYKNKKAHARNIGLLYDNLIAVGKSHEEAVQFIADAFDIHSDAVRIELGVWKRWHTTTPEKQKRDIEAYWDELDKKDL